VESSIGGGGLGSSSGALTTDDVDMGREASAMPAKRDRRANANRLIAAREEKLVTRRRVEVEYKFIDYIKPEVVLGRLSIQSLMSRIVSSLS